MSHRLFVGIRPPPPIRDRLLDTMEGIEAARWQDERQLHLTLRFVGEVETPAANDIAAALGHVSAPPFELGIEGVGTFDRKGSATAVWARVRPSEALEALRQKVERACETAGIARETRRFTPHVTLARLNRASGEIGPWLSSFSDLRLDGWPVEDFILYESHLGNEGSYYEPVATYRLRPR